MREYTPNIAQVRRFWASDGALQPAAKSYDFEESAAEFDRFIRGIKAEAWDECCDAVSTQGTVQLPENPHRDHE